MPEGPPTGTQTPATAVAESKGKPIPMADASDPGLDVAFRDDFERRQLGSEWRALSPAWTLTGGELCVSGARNRGIWLRRRLPTNARIEFDARSESAEGDIKAELWGDGLSGATGATYDDATSYLVIFGGWKNSRHVLARLDEHGEDARSVETLEGAPEPRFLPVSQGQTYHFKIERRDGRVLTWWIDDFVMHEWDDDEPLAGEGHDHFGFNDWMARVCYDNVEVTPL